MAKKILVIDDESKIRDSLEKLLGGQGYQVLTAADGEAGLAQVVEARPDLVILDVMMPGRNGFEICKDLKTDPRYHFFSKIPVLMLTVYPSDGTAEQTHAAKLHLPLSEGMTMLAEDYLQKPFDNEELLNRVRKLLK
jgi:CheY-like chemotaxis protein